MEKFYSTLLTCLCSQNYFPSEIDQIKIYLKNFQILFFSEQSSELNDVILTLDRFIKLSITLDINFSLTLLQ